MKGIILSSFHWTGVVANIVGGTIVQKWGGKSTLAFSILTAAILTLLTPVIVMWADSTGLIGVRVLMGLANGLMYPAVNTLMVRWIPEHERSMAGTLTHSGEPVGTIISMSISGLILQYSHDDWTILFYFFGSIGIVSFLVTFVFCYDKPNDNPFISIEEIKYINEHSTITETNTSATPWKDILTSKPVWALITVSAGVEWTCAIIDLDMPKYMSGVLRYSAGKTGYLSAVPQFSMLIFSFLAAFISDLLIANGAMSVTRVRIIGATFAATGSGICFVLASYAGCNRTLVVTWLAIGMGFMGCNYCSIMINTLDLSPNYAGVLMGLVEGISDLSSILGPWVVGFLTPHQTISEWRMILWTTFIFGAGTNSMYLIFGSGEVQDWNGPNSPREAENPRENANNVRK